MAQPIIIFQSNGINPNVVDPDFEEEYSAAKSAGFVTYLLDTELFDDGDIQRALRRMRDHETDAVALFRGWMMTSETYRLFFDALQERGITLINTPAQYRHAHHLPESFSIIEAVSPKTVWTDTGPNFDMETLMALLTPFHGAPVIVKDYVKSQKHRWQEACFVPSSDDYAEVERVAKSFVSYQGDSLVGGLVFREYVDLEPLTSHPKSGMPLSKEYRIFCLNGQKLCTTEYWEDGDYLADLPPKTLFDDIVTRVQSRFFTMDVARLKDGQWIIMELGDGQVSGLPDRLTARRFYNMLKRTVVFNQ